MTPLPHRSHSDDLLSFISASPSPYHAVASAAQRLEKAGFRELRGTDDWTGTTGGSFVARGGALIAWYVPEGAPAHTPSGSSAPTPIRRTCGSSPLPTPPARAGGRSGWRSTAAFR